jgi:hypothetical protein
MPALRRFPLRSSPRCATGVLLLLLTSSGVAGCGSPSSPTSSRDVASLPAASALPPGRYTLAVSSTTASGPGTSAVIACAGRGDNSARLAVDVAVEGTGWRGTSPDGTLVFTLQRNGAEVWGPIAGRATAYDGTVVEFGDNSVGIVWNSRPGAAGVGGTIVSAGQVRGDVEGGVLFRYASGYGTCAAQSFQMTR